MAGYDGEIRINTKIDVAEAQQELIKLQNHMNKTAQKIETLSKKMKEMETAKVPTEEYKEVQSHITSTRDKLSALNEKMEKYIELGKNTNSNAFKSMQYDAAQLENTLIYLEGEMRELKASGRAFMNQTGTDAYKKVSVDLQNANGEMTIIKSKMQEVLAKQKKINGEGFKKLSQSAQKASGSMKKLAKSNAGAQKGFSSLTGSIKQMVLSMVVFTVMQKGIEFLKSGLQNLAVYSKEYNKSMSELTSSTSQLKNAFAVAFQPILNVVIPILSKLVNWISAAANAVSRFFAILGGKSTYTKAIKQNKDYAASLDKVGGSADKTKGSLAGFDELEVMQKNDSSSGGGGTDGADGSGFIEESVGDTSKFEAIKQALGEIVNIFKSGFAAGLGDWESRLTDIQQKTQMIKDALKNIFTDPAVVSGAATFAQALIYNLGVVVGAVASIGLTIAQNLIGGIALYLTENTDRIKQYLVNMFDIGTDIANLIGSFAESFAYVFEAFGSENGQKLTANLIGIFSSAFMGVSELCGRLVRDLLNIIIKPFVDNKEALRTALEGFLGTAATVCGTIKNTIDNTFNKLLEVYDEHIKPFFDSIATGLSELAGKFLEFWNTQVQPVMNSLAAKFDEVMSQHIQPMLNNAIELFGSIADALKTLWEQMLKPLIAWVIENVLPVLLPIFKSLYTGVLECIGFISDAISGLITVIRGIIDFLVGVFTGDWDRAWNAVATIVSGVMDRIEAKINLALTAVKTIVVTILNAVKARFEIVFNAIKTHVQFVLNKVKSIITGAMTSIKGGITQALTTIKSKWIEIWTSLKTSVVNIFNEIWTAIKGVINSILGGVESMANGVITGINNVIAALNNFKITFPDWVPLAGGNTLGFSLTPLNTISIPRLANGGITTGSTLANIGEAGREAVIPLERNTEWMNTFAEMLAGKMGGTGAQAVDLTVNLDGNQIYKRIVQLDREFAGRTGYSQFVY